MLYSFTFFAQRYSVFHPRDERIWMNCKACCCCNEALTSCPFIGELVLLLLLLTSLAVAYEYILIFLFRVILSSMAYAQFHYSMA